MAQKVVRLTESGTNKAYSWTVAVFFALVLLLVLVNVFSPLRLNNDAGRYLGILEYFKGGLGQNSDAAHDYLPHGYPYFLYILERAHLLSPFSITLFNILSAVVAALLLMKEFAVSSKLFYLTLVLISYINIKEYALPVSDQLFTLLFMVAVLLWTRSFKGNLYYVVPALIITAISIYVRTAGVAIIIGVAAYLIYLNRDRLKKRKIILGLTFLLIAAFTVIFIIDFNFFEKKIDYIRQLDLPELTNPVNLAGRVSIHLKELGEIMINIPVSKLSDIIDRHLEIASPILIVFGIISLWMYFKAVKKLNLIRSFAFWVFTAYLLMIFAWPFYDTRFLIPIVPLLVFLYLYYLFTVLKSRYVRFCLLSVYIGLGVVSLVYSDALSLSKPFFLKHYGADANITNMYRDHFSRQSKTSPSQVYDIHKDYLPFLLEEYDRKPFFYFSR